MEANETSTLQVKVEIKKTWVAPEFDIYSIAGTESGAFIDAENFNGIGDS